MNTRISLALGAITLLSGVAPAAAGYWFDASGTVVRSSAGECYRTGYWTPEDAIVGCDGKAAEAAPKPVVAAVTPAVKTAAVRSEGAVIFGFDRADLDQEAITLVDGLLGKVKGMIKSVRLTGHTDRIGTEDYNLDLSLRRASAVSDYITEGIAIDPEKIEIAGKGESQPLVGCEGLYGTAAIRCLAPNRRVDVMIDTF